VRRDDFLAMLLAFDHDIHVHVLVYDQPAARAKGLHLLVRINRPAEAVGDEGDYREIVAGALFICVDRIQRVRHIHFDQAVNGVRSVAEPYQIRHAKAIAGKREFVEW
jgi:hypothetical protein